MNSKTHDLSALTKSNKNEDFKSENEKSIVAVSSIKRESNEIEWIDECNVNSKTCLKVEVDELEKTKMETEDNEEPIIQNKSDDCMDVVSTTVFESVKNEQNNWYECGIDNLSAPELKLEMNDSILRRVGGESEDDMLTHPENPSKYRFTITCIHCNTIFESKVTVDDHVAKCHPEFTTSNSNNIYECTTCVYITTEKENFDRHMKLHLETVSNEKFKRCIHCDTTFKGTSSMNEHIVRKHPEFIASVTVKVHECTVCTYKTTKKPNFYRHMSVHPEIDISYTLQKCNHCDAKFKNKSLVDEHIIKAHPEFIMFSKFYECTSCAYKTTINSCFKRHILTHLTYKCTECTYKTNVKTALDSHMLQHPEISNQKDVKCVHCDAAFKRKLSLDDHVVRLHPEFIESVTSKLHTCTQCSYKTVLKHVFEKHVLEHGGSDTSSQPNTCRHCKVKFKNGISLDDHIVKKHEEFISAVNRKIHKCEQCAYKTVLKTSYNEHILKSHPENLGSLSMKVYECLRCSYKTFKRNAFDYHCISSHPQTDSSSKSHACIHCNKTFRSKRALENHVVKKHPDFISSVTEKIYQCTKCVYKTVSKYNLERHMLTHPETISSSKLVPCIHCRAILASDDSLNDHIAKKHPLVTSPNAKSYECSKCDYKTTRKCYFDKHVLIHSETLTTPKLLNCSYCDASFKLKRSLYDHIVRIHPEYSDSVWVKIHECPQCSYKSVKKDYIERHMRGHSEIV